MPAAEFRLQAAILSWFSGSACVLVSSWPQWMWLPLGSVLQGPLIGDYGGRYITIDVPGMAQLRVEVVNQRSVM